MIDCNSLNDFNPRLKAGRSAAMNKLEHTRLLLDCANLFWLLQSFLLTLSCLRGSVGISIPYLVVTAYLSIATSHHSYL